LEALANISKQSSCGVAIYSSRLAESEQALIEACRSFLCDDRKLDTGRPASIAANTVKARNRVKLRIPFAPLLQR
jgi:hypothetical protein